MTQTQEQFDQEYMTLALSLAQTASSLGEVPVGALIVNANGDVIATGYNSKEKTNDPTDHAEIKVIRKASQNQMRWRLTECTLYVTLEPCAMCAGAIIAARLKRIVYATLDPKAGAMGSLYDIHKDPRLNHNPECHSGVFADEASCMLKDFFRARRSSKN